MEQLKFTRCPHCNTLIAKTKHNPKAVCPAYACKSNTVFYESDNNQEAYQRRMALSDKYRGLYFYSEADCTLHFLYALSEGRMLFINDTNYALYIFLEDELEGLCSIFNSTNYHSFVSSEK